MSNDKAGALDQEGQRLLQEGKYVEAVKAFQAACRLDDSPVLKNNLATAYYSGREMDKVLETLAPNIEAGASPNPYAHSLAVQALVALGREKEAPAELREAVRDFEDGLAVWRRAGWVPDSWKEYTRMVLRAAGDLLEHRRVYELYRRWDQYHVTWECDYLAGVAAFNLKRFSQAAKCWAGARELGRLSAALQRVALLADRGAVPAFPLEYELPTTDKLERLASKAAASEEERYRYAGRGIVRLYLLCGSLDPQFDDKMVHFNVSTLVTYGGEWGQRLAEALLEAGSVSRTVKMAAAKALVELGVYRLNEPIRVIIDGREDTLTIKEVTVTDELDGELEEMLEEAHRLRSEGKYEEAVQLLNDLQGENKLYPQALMLLADLHRRQGQMQEYRGLLETLETVYPDNISVLFNLTSLWCQLGEEDKARAYLKRLEKCLEGQEPTAELIEQLPLLREQVELLEELSDEEEGDQPFIPAAESIVKMLAEEWREDVEQKPLSVNVGLAKGLKNMPADWLDGMCIEWGIEPARLRKEREKQITAYLSDDRNLEEMVADLRQQEIELLRLLLEKEGWSKISVLSRRFGSLEGDGYFWNEKRPASPLGRLWSRALVFVGKARLGERNHKIAAIPVELRERLSHLLQKHQ